MSMGLCVVLWPLLRVVSILESVSDATEWWDELRYETVGRGSEMDDPTESPDRFTIEGTSVNTEGGELAFISHIKHGPLKYKKRTIMPAADRAACSRLRCQCFVQLSIWRFGERGSQCAVNYSRLVPENWP